MTSLRTALRYAGPLAQACLWDHIRLGDTRVHVPGPAAIRLSVVAGNIRLHRLMDRVLRPGQVVVDVGANIGYDTVHAARRVGPSGRVVAIEPTDDNLVVLRHNIAANHFANVEIHAAAAGSARGRRDFYVRGEVSAVNSLYPESCYADVTAVVPVEMVRIDDLVETAALVKIDVEGGELEALSGMPRLLRNPHLHLIVEWHPRLQEAAGYEAGALPRTLLGLGFTLHAVSHMRTEPLTAAGVDALADRLRRSGHPVELFAHR